MNPGIFREYDIRGIAGKDLNENDVELIGKGIGTFLMNHGCRSITLGHDCRVTSEAYTHIVANGILSTGCDVIDIGVCPTPVLYFSIAHLKPGGGVMVTASHNPKEYNGFKVCLGLDSVHGQDLQTILEIIKAGSFISGQGKRSAQEVLPAYHDHLRQNIKISRPLRIGVDAGNGTAGVVALPLFKHFGCETHALYCDMDGTFPNHEADPTVLKNMTDLIALVKREKLDVGVGFDGDGDRIGIIDDQGDIVYGDKLLLLFAREILERKPGATFISEVKCSKVLYDDIEQRGGRAIMWKTGHSLIKLKMKQEKAELAGEMSGHMFFADRYFGFDDAVYAALRLLEIIANTGKSVSELLSDVPKTISTPEIRVDCPDDIKFKIVSQVTDHFKKSHNVIDIDGVRVIFSDGWGLVRASNTQPALVLRFEATSQSRLDEIRSLIENTLANYQHS